MRKKLFSFLTITAALAALSITTVNASSVLDRVNLEGVMDIPTVPPDLSPIDPDAPKDTWIHTEGKWYYYDYRGHMYKDVSVVLQDGKHYRFDPNGVMLTGWRYWENETWYYSDPVSGEVAKGWQKINEKWYYLDPERDGALLVNGITPDGYVVDGNGVYTGRTASDVIPAENTSSNYIQTIHELVNVHRSDFGLPPLQLSDQLNAVADVRAGEISTLFSHTRPSGTISDLYAQNNYRWSTLGENIAMGYRSPQEVVNGWMNSPGHRANILNRSFTDIGIGHFTNGTDHWVQVFGTKK